MSLFDAQSVFEVSVGVNLAYAGIENFKDAVSARVGAIGTFLLTWLKTRIELLESEVVACYEGARAESVKTRLKEKYDAYIVEMESEEFRKKDWMNEAPGFLKPLFLASALYSLTYLIVLSFSNYYSGGSDTLYTISFIIQVNFAVFILYIFIKSFTPEYKSKIALSVKIGMVVAPFLFSILVVKFFPSLGKICLKCQDWISSYMFGPLEESNTAKEIFIQTVSVCIGYASFVLYFTRIFIHLLRHEMFCLSRAYGMIGYMRKVSKASRLSREL